MGKGAAKLIRSRGQRLTCKVSLNPGFPNLRGEVEMNLLGSPRGGNAPRGRDRKPTLSRQLKWRLPAWLHVLAPPALLVISLHGDVTIQIRLHGLMTIEREALGKTVPVGLAEGIVHRADRPHSRANGAANR